MASELSGGPSGSAAIVVPASRSHRVDHQSFGLECRTSGGRVFWPATDRARVSRPQRRRMVRLGADVSLDRQQDPDSRLLLYARHLAASVSSSRVPECVAGAERRAVSGGTPPDSTVRPRSEEHTSELQSLRHLVCRLLLEKKKNVHSRAECL